MQYMGFNEAPAILPGKAALLARTGAGSPNVASMRPRRFCRGKLFEAALSMARGCGLQ